MVDITEDFESYLQRVTRGLVVRLIAAEGEDPTLLNQVRMTARLIKRLEGLQHLLVVHEMDRVEDVLLDEIINPGRLPVRSHTWKEIGEALGISAQAAHRKYGSKVQKQQGVVTDITDGKDAGPTS